MRWDDVQWGGVLDIGEMSRPKRLRALSDRRSPPVLHIRDMSSCTNGVFGNGTGPPRRTARFLGMDNDAFMTFLTATGNGPNRVLHRVLQSNVTIGCKFGNGRAPGSEATMFGCAKQSGWVVTRLSMVVYSPCSPS